MCCLTLWKSAEHRISYDLKQPDNITEPQKIDISGKMQVIPTVNTGWAKKTGLFFDSL